MKCPYLSKNDLKKAERLLGERKNIKNVALYGKIIITGFLHLFALFSVEFALNYVKTEVIPGAVERYLAEQEREKNNGKILMIMFCCVPGLYKFRTHYVSQICRSFFF